MLESLTAFVANGRKGLRLSIVAMATMLLASAARHASGAAVTVVNWGGVYTSGTTQLNLIGQTAGQSGSDYRNYRPFRDDAPAFCLSPTSGYSGKPFYGGFDAYNYGASGNSTITPIYRTSLYKNWISIIFKGSSSSAAALAVVFLKQDFIALQDRPHIYMDADDATISMTSQTLSSYLSARFILRNGSTYYLSEYTFGANAPGVPITLANPSTSTRWAAYDPTSSLMFNPTSFDYVHFSDVTAAGYYIFSNNLPGGVLQETSTYQFGLTASDIAAVAPVPLPMAFWAGSALLAGIVAAHLRRRRAQWA